MEPTWIPIPKYDNYWISDDGQIGYMRDGKLDIKIPQYHEKGYIYVRIWKNGKRFKCYVHRMMLIAFKGPPPPGKIHAHHVDEIKDHNVLSNLVWNHSLNQYDDPSDIDKYPSSPEDE